MVYAIWDAVTANMVGSYDTEAEALADVRDAVTRFGREYASGWALVSHHGDEAEEALAEGDALIERALAAGART